MNKNYWKNAFTFVELIIMVIILIILSTIGFMSYTSYISDTKDSKRKMDFTLIQTALKSYKDKNKIYPLPWQAFKITYSGSIVAIQWKLDTSVNLTTLETIPTDPDTWQYYSYSVTQNQKEYQIWWTLSNNWENTVLLKGTYNSVNKDILPNIILATPAVVDIEIASGSLEWNMNRKLFLFNNSSDTILYGLEWDDISQNNIKTFSEKLQEAEQNNYWQKHTYWNCIEIKSAGKSIGAWEYQIKNSSWTLVHIWCDMDESL